MRKVIIAAGILLVIASCDTPGQAIGTPEGTTNTTGTTGSANMTNGTDANPATRTTPGTPTDTATTKKDSLPR